MSKLIVTGGAGFIGSHLTDKLIELGHEVVVIDNLTTGKKENLNPKAIFHQLDIRYLKLIQPLFHNAEAVFHLAADPRLQISVEDPIGTHEINVTGTLNVLFAAKTAGVKKVVFSSSCAIYGEQKLPIKEEDTPNPLSPYGLHKLMGGYYCRLFSGLYGLPTVALRYFNVFGSRKSADGGYPMVIPIFLKQRQADQELTIVGDGEQTRDYVHVSDVVEANIKAWQSAVKSGETINVGSGRQISVNFIAKLIGGKTVNLPARAGEMRFIEADNKKARELLDWAPKMKFEDGLNNLLNR